MTLITNKTPCHCDELVEQAATGLATRHSRVPVAHSFGVFFYTFFTHGHGWRHGVRIYEATRVPTSSKINLGKAVWRTTFVGNEFPAEIC